MSSSIFKRGLKHVGTHGELYTRHVQTRVLRKYRTYKVSEIFSKGRVAEVRIIQFFDT